MDEFKGELDQEELKKIIESNEFQKVKDELVKKYNINASAKYTLTPRDDFIYKLIIEFVEIAVKQP